MKPLRVLHIIESLGRGGAERQLVNQLLAHDRSLIQPSVIALNPPLDLADELRSAGIAVMTLNLPAFGDMPFAILRLIGIIKLLRPDVIHTWLTRADLSGRIAAVLGGHIPVVGSIQAPIYAPTMYLDNATQKHWKLTIVRQLDRWSGRWARVNYVGCSHDVARSTGDALAISPERLRVIYNSVDPINSTKHSAGKRIIAVGRLVPQKGYQYLIAAMPAILAHHPDATLQIIGDGTLRTQMEGHIAALKIDHTVTMLGIRADVPELLANSDLFVFPSLWEGLGVVVLEALASSLPVIASNIAVIREIIDDGIHGILVQPQNSEALAQAVIKVLNNPEYRQQLGHAGQQRIAERFDINVTVRQWEQLYLTITAKGK